MVSKFKDIFILHSLKFHIQTRFIQRIIAIYMLVAEFMPHPVPAHHHNNAIDLCATATVGM